MVFKNRDKLNKINVFPVPDGDTGSNMSMTLLAVVREIENLKEVSLETTLKAAAWGGMMGARGNSGIILAQVFNGLVEVIDGNDRLFADNIAQGLDRAVKKAYKALLNPTEGTILTVMRDTAEAAEQAAKKKKDLAYLIEEMVSAARSSVERTPSLLPKLKEAGVVDAGGLGFLYFLEGMLNLVLGVISSGMDIQDEGIIEGMVDESSVKDISNRYCTEFILKGSLISEDAIKADLSRIGDSIVVVGDSRLARVHVHTNEPEKVLKYASELGNVSSIKVDDMLHQHTSRSGNISTSKASSVVAIVLGDGLKEIFYNAGAELVMDGGPTKNPSTSEIISAIDTVSSSNVIVLPNHKNVYPAALQASDIAQKKVTVLKTTTVPEGISAMLAYMEDAPFEENISRMDNAFANVKSGAVMRASKDAIAGKVNVSAGDSIGVYKGEIRCSSGSAQESLIGLLEQMVDPSSEIITLFYGDDVKKADAEDMQIKVQSIFQDKTIELYFGGQPHAQYIISVE